MKHKSHLTAISRKTLPRPTKWLLGKNKVVGKVLDYGCGKCYAVNPAEWHSYDPYYFRAGIRVGKLFDTIICNYVLCVLPPAERLAVLQEIQRFLKPEGIAYISVRNDKPKQGWGLSSKGTYQGRVRKLPLPLLYKNSSWRTYTLTKTTELV